MHRFGLSRDIALRGEKRLVERWRAGGLAGEGDINNTIPLLPASLWMILASMTNPLRTFDDQQLITSHCICYTPYPDSSPRIRPSPRHPRTRQHRPSCFLALRWNHASSLRCLLSLPGLGNRYHLRTCDRDMTRVLSPPDTCSPCLTHIQTSVSRSSSPGAISCIFCSPPLASLRIPLFQKRLVVRDADCEPD